MTTPKTNIAHDFIRTGDPDTFPQICDRNGEVALSYCRVCHRAEGQLGAACPGVPSEWSRLQLDVSDWALHNFGLQGAWQPMLGLIEEVGEYLTAREMLHGSVHIGAPKAGPQGQEAATQMADAIADQCIYACNLCEITGVSLAQIAANSPPAKLLDAEILKSLAAACHAVLKFEQGIRGVDDRVRREKLQLSLSLWFGWASFQCGHFGLKPILECTQEVWREVSMRDWRKNPTSANQDAANAAALQKQVTP